MTTQTHNTKLAGSFGIALFTAIIAATSLQAQNGHAIERLQLLKTRSCDNCNLSGEDFRSADLKGISVASANLSGAGFYKADLTNANLGGADLTKAVLTFANLTNTNLGGANLTGANLTGAVSADLSRATTTDTTTCPDGQAGPCR
jgi:uncharacterized protein YjbI with pentapeptide repeats